MKQDLRPRAEKKYEIEHDGIDRVTFSFYKYVNLTDPKALQADLQERWGALGCLGRIYLAHEGINAQMSCPKDRWGQFDAYLRSRPEFSGIPYKIAIEEGEAPSFYKLTIKVKDKIVADGLNDATFDVNNTGAYLTAREMNEYIDDPEVVVVDMRNGYESEVGHFNGAICPDVDTFREELAVVPEQLKIHKHKKIALYCTGGIRCEKASAWLKHNGFENVKHLKGGIINYKHQVAREGLENKFAGKNFVFDERLGERVGEEIISTCHLCKTNKSDTHYHCKNQICYTLYIGCDVCVARKSGYCSLVCRHGDKLPDAYKKRLARYYNLYVRKRQPFKKTRLRA
jgi:UPF0176 protein